MQGRLHAHAVLAVRFHRVVGCEGLRRGRGRGGRFGESRERLGRAGLVVGQRSTELQESLVAWVLVRVVFALGVRVVRVLFLFLRPKVRFRAIAEDLEAFLCIGQLSMRCRFNGSESSVKHGKTQERTVSSFFISRRVLYTTNGMPKAFAEK